MLINTSIFIQNTDRKCTDVLVGLGCLVVILSLALFVMWCVFIYKKEQHKIELKRLLTTLSRQLSSSVEYERAAVAKNLHDDVSMPLNVAKLHLAKILRNTNNKEFLRNTLVDTMNLLDESIGHIRNIAKRTSPPTLMKLGYAKGISELCKQINASEQLKIKVVNTGTARLPHPIELEAYRITQEILNNIMKYSYTTEIDITINSDEKEVNTIISYIGFGINSKMADELSETDKGVGLKSIQNRATMIGASVHYHIIRNNEYKTIIKIPIYEQFN